jgi:hypothetical protein
VSKAGKRPQRAGVFARAVISSLSHPYYVSRGNRSEKVFFEDGEYALFAIF